MSDYLQSEPPEMLPSHLADPYEKKAYEQGVKQEISQRLNEIHREMRANPGLYSQNITEAETIYIRNNKPFSVEVSDAGRVIPGQLDDKKGPFAMIPRREMDSFMTYAMLMEPNEEGRSTLTELTKEDYQQQYRDHKEQVKTRKARLAGNEMVTDAEKERRDDFKVIPTMGLNTPIDQG